MRQLNSHMDGFLVVVCHITLQETSVDSHLDEAEQVVLNLTSHTSCLDTYLNNFEGNVRSQEYQVKGIKVTIKCNDALLAAKQSRISESGSKESKDTIVS